VDVAGGIVPTQSNIRSRLARAGCATLVEGSRMSAKGSAKADKGGGEPAQERRYERHQKSDGVKDIKRAKNGERRRATKAHLYISTYVSRPFQSALSFATPVGVHHGTHPSIASAHSRFHHFHLSTRFNQSLDDYRMLVNHESPPSLFAARCLNIAFPLTMFL
jgi:hypothetical protein